MARLCIVPGKLQGIGGPASFQRKLTNGFIKRGIEVTYDLNDEPYDAVLLINATRQLVKLWQRKRRGIRVVQRLGGINWVHRYLQATFRAYLLAELRNLNMRFVRSLVADHVVYQSHFVSDWWGRKHGAPKVASTIIYNGVDLTQFHPEGARYQSKADVCILSVEGTQGADPFDIAVHLAQALEERGVQVELLIFGRTGDDTRSRLAEHSFVSFKGQIPSSELPFFYRGATFLIFADIIPAGCPNSVIEALACGTPVLGYRAGVLAEMLNDSAGRCVECRGDPWKGKPPGNLEGMVRAACELLGDRNRFQQGARSLAEERYGLDKMVDSYCAVLFG